MASCMEELSFPRKRLAKIRCLQNCIECFRNNKPLPEAICYVPAEVEYKITKNAKVTLYSEPNKQCEKVSDRSVLTGHTLIASGEDLCNAQGQWIKAIRVCIHCLLCCDKSLTMFTAVENSGSLLKIQLPHFPAGCPKLMHTLAGFY